jgi:hypothetical protein
MGYFLFNILREYNFRRTWRDSFLSEFYPFIDHPEYIPPREDFNNLSKDWINVNQDLGKSIQECKTEHNLILS